MKYAVVSIALALWVAIFVVLVPRAIGQTYANDRAAVEMHKLAISENSNGMGTLPLNPYLR